MSSNIDPSIPPLGNATTSSVRANFSAAKSEIEELQNSRGFADYNDTATAITPLVVLPNTWKKLTNNAAGVNTKIVLPAGVSGIWDTVNNQFDFGTLPVNTMIDLRVDLSVTITAPNQTVEMWIVLAIGTATEFSLPMVVDEQYKAVGTYRLMEYMGAYIGNTDTQNAPCELRLRSDAGATVVVNGWYIRVVTPAGT